MAKKKKVNLDNKWMEMMELLGNILGYEKGQKFPTVLPKKISELRKGYSDEVIYETILRCQRDIETALRTKEFKSEYSMCAYVAAIIVNSINDVKIEFEMIERAKKVKANTAIIMDETAIANHKQHVTDISKWLED